MQDNKDKQQQQSGERNPTLDKPGSQVTDYGNTTGGSSNDRPQQDQDRTRQQQENENIPLGNDETIGNP